MYYKNSKSFIKGFIYSTDTFRKIYEKQAKSNLVLELETISKHKAFYK